MYLCSSDSLRVRAGGTKGGGPEQKRAVRTLDRYTDRVVVGRGERGDEAGTYSVPPCWTKNSP